jgi:radical SAM protein with 4Fe4S-binding SPASM domain
VSGDNELKPLSYGRLRTLRDKGLDKVIFNLQGADSETHDFITRRHGSFNALSRSIELAKDLGFWVGAHFVPMKPNAKSIQAVLEFAREKRIDEVALLRFVPQGRGGQFKNQLKLSKENLWKFLEEVANLRRRFEKYPEIRTGCPLDFLSFIDESVKLSSCKAATSTCAITPTGDLIPCPAFKHLPSLVAGNIREQSLIEIWRNSKILKSFRAALQEEISVCSDCERVKLCKGRCVAQRIRAHGDLLIGPDPDCLEPHLKTKKNKIQNSIKDTELEPGCISIGL